MIRNKHLLWLYAIFLLLTATACHDSDSQPDEPEYPGIDNFEGRIREFFLTDETDRFEASDCDIKILAPDKSIISRKCTHSRKGGKSTFKLATGLKEGEYRLLYIEYPIDPIKTENGEQITTRQFGLGCILSADSKGVYVTSSYDPQIGLSGKGTSEDPYIVSSYDHLMMLANKVNSDASNALFTENTYIRQIVDIDMDDACFFTDIRYGWEPIGNDVNLPFRSVYQGAGLSNIWCLRDKSPAIGLFGYIHKARIDGVEISGGEFSGNFAVGAVAGASITSGAHRDRTEISNCRVKNSKVSGSAGSLAIGGVLGIADMNSKIMIYECHNENTAVSGDYNIGGIMGAGSAYSLSSINNCSNSGKITGGFSGAGGIIGSCDTLYVTSCRNTADIIGGRDFRTDDGKSAATGTGGIAGGTGMAFITGCSNEGAVTGVNGVGGLLGSSRVAGDASTPLIYNNAAFRYCSNTGNVQGQMFVGGINGESQIGTFGVLNKGKVTGDSYVGGIAGNASIAVAHNAVNIGDVVAKSFSGGILGKATFASLALNDNYGKISATGDHTGGIIGLSGNNTIIHYCGNHGLIENTSGRYVGGIVGEVGDPRKWTGWNIAECVVAAAEIVMAVAGPCIAVAEHAVEESSHVLSLILKYGEFSFDMLLHATDVVLWSDTTAEMVSGETSEEVSASIKAKTMELAVDINQSLSQIRSDKANYSIEDISSVPLHSIRSGYVTSLAEWYAEEGNDDIFNEGINEKREERMEQNEKAEHTKEIVHQTIGGVCIVVGTVASIVATVASGGVAAGFLLVGSAVSVVGGVNAIVKCCTEFEANVAIISQCVSSGNIIGSDNAGALAGTLNDRTLARDCLILGTGTGKEHCFACHLGSGARIDRCVQAGSGWTDIYYIGGDGSAVVRSDNYGFDKPYYEALSDRFVMVSPSGLNNASTYVKLKEHCGMDISDSTESIWTLSKASDSKYQYPVPSWSEMR